MDKMLWAWLLFGGYLLATIFIAWRGAKKTTSFSSFALGKKDMGPFLVGITVAAATASTATFVINPGFVYKHGLSAFLHFAVASPIGVLLAISLFSRKFREIGYKEGVLTLPHWIEKKFKSSAMGSYFAWMNLALSITFVVLIVKGSALVMQHTLGIGYILSVFLVVGIVFSYIFFGGTYAHAYTNAFQGFIMIFVAMMLVASGAHLFGDGLSGFLTQLNSISANYAAPYNPESGLFTNFWEVFFCVFLISVGLACQPHILMKSMYLRSDKEVTPYIVVASIVGIIFAGILVCGFYARLTIGAELTQDSMMAVYINQAFSPFLGVVISVALMAAGMSTLDGILVGASTIASNDIVMKWAKNGWLKNASEEQVLKQSLNASRIILVIMGVGALILAINPPKLVGLFAQMGIYGLTAASIFPIFCGMYLPNLSTRQVFYASVLGPAVHFTLYIYKFYYLGEVINPSVTAAIGIGSGCLFLVVSEVFVRRFLPRTIGAQS